MRRLFDWLLALGLIVLVVWFSLARVGVSFNFEFVSQYQTRIIDGFILTIYISIASMVLSLIFGLLGALGQLSRLGFLKILANLYVTLIRGTPLIMQIYLFFYIVGTAWGVDNRFLAGVLILSVFEGAYIAEMIRAAYLSLDTNQLLAAKSVGFDRIQTFRFVISPQLMARLLPGLAGQLASIIKDSSLLSMISVIELTQTMREISATNFQLFECYFLLGLLYLVLTLPIHLLTKWLERKSLYGTTN